MIKKIMHIALTVAFLLAQSSLAGAFVSDDKTAPITASVDLSGGTPVASLSVAVKNVSDNTSASSISWAGVNLGDGWKKASQYLEVTYAANQIGWGVEIYTDNMGTTMTAIPQFTGDPTTDPNQQPAGLIGTQNTLLTAPLAVLVTDGVIPTPDTNLQIPVEQRSGTPGQSDFVIFFTSGYDEDTQATGIEKVWFWLKDLSTTKWLDLNSDGDIDLTGSFGGPDYELVSDFSSTGDDYATIVNTYGSSSGWVNQTTKVMQRDNTSSSPIDVYIAAKFANARELQEYKTNTITLEIYHE